MIVYKIYTFWDYANVSLNPKRLIAALQLEEREHVDIFVLEVAKYLK